MALSKEELNNIKLPLSDEDYVKLHEEEVCTNYGVWENAELKLRLHYVLKYIKCYDERFPGNHVEVEHMRWTAPLTKEERALLKESSIPVLTKDEVEKIKLPLSDEDYIKLRAFEDADQYLELSSYQELEQAYHVRAANLFDKRYSGNDISIVEISWEKPNWLTLNNVDEIKDPLTKKVAMRALIEHHIDYPNEPMDGYRLNKLFKRLEENESTFNKAKIPNSKMLSYGIQMAFYHIEAGRRDFLSFAEAMDKDLGHFILPYLKSFYNGARDIMLDCGNEEEKKMAAEMYDYYTIEKLIGEMKNDSITIDEDDDDDESNNCLAYMGIEDKKSKEREEIERAGFELIKDSDGIDRGQWTHDLIKAYPHEVIDAFGSDPFEVTGLLEDMWDTDDYEDPESGLTMSWDDWSAFFCNNATKRVYWELVDEHKNRLKYEERAKQLQQKIDDMRNLLE